MTLKEILAKHLGNDYPRRNFLYPQLQTDLEELIEGVYRAGGVDREIANHNKQMTCMDSLWNQNKERFSGK